MTGRPRASLLERTPFQRNRSSLSLSFRGRIFCGEPVSTSPENALASKTVKANAAALSLSGQPLRSVCTFFNGRRSASDAQLGRGTRFSPRARAPAPSPQEENPSPAALSPQREGPQPLWFWRGPSTEGPQRPAFRAPSPPPCFAPRPRGASAPLSAPSPLPPEAECVRRADRYNEKKTDRPFAWIRCGGGRGAGPGGGCAAA